MSKIEKVKKFVDEHKKEIIVGTICTAVGACFGWKLYQVARDFVINHHQAIPARDQMCMAMKRATNMTSYLLKEQPEHETLWDDCIDAMIKLKEKTEISETSDPVSIVVFLKDK